ncbi:hypothetical protein FB45DRAFT_928648 [Roridomyces roridus]|uniref:NAD(P)-binding domain-containing protein n=1 Tax=Roridomyces roridus TaxID=1738132 RepID=A0AAD7BHQ0_9AGAR|nr:hypothetical protein FB45DRAFT_928648 [Roridomyces roridus]
MRPLNYLLSFLSFNLFPVEYQPTQPETMRILVTGGTGAAGLEILRTANADPSITQVTVLLRGALPASVPPSPKMTVVKHTDFMNYPAELVKDHDACVWALGRGSSGLTEAQYAEFTHDYPVAALTAFAANIEPGHPFRFVYFSGDGADPSQKSGQMWARVKGRTETDLQAIAKASNGTIHTHSLRPGYFFPADQADRQNTRSRGARVTDVILAPLLRTVAPKFIVPISDLALVALGLAKGTLGDAEVLSNTDIVNAAATAKKA